MCSYDVLWWSRYNSVNVISGNNIEIDLSFIRLDVSIWLYCADADAGNIFCHLDIYEGWKYTSYYMQKYWDIFLQSQFRQITKENTFSHLHLQY